MHGQKNMKLGLVLVPGLIFTGPKLNILPKQVEEL
jgi:hypothetical protein